MKTIELGFSTLGISMAMRVYYACKTFGVKEE